MSAILRISDGSRSSKQHLCPPLAPDLCTDARDAAPTSLVPLRPKRVVARRGSSSPPVSGQACALVAPTTAATLNFASLGVQRQRIDATLSESTVRTWAMDAASELGGIYAYETMPRTVEAMLHSGWNLRCDTKKYAHRGLSLLSAEIKGVVDSTVRCPEELRVQEFRRFAPQLLTRDEFNSWHFTFYFDLRPYVRADAMFNLLITLFVIVLLVVGALLFSHDANTLLLRPVEQMVERVEAIRANPLVAMNMSEDEAKAEEAARELASCESRLVPGRLLASLSSCKRCSGRQTQQPMETAILERTIIKLGTLLALGFGEAGANIIAQNISSSSSAGVNAMVPGTCVNTIIGVVRVRGFSVATEVLQSRINNFCNQIAEIVHGICHEFHGGVNKNNGDGFLVIWRLDKDQHREHTQRLADMSVVAFATILGALHPSSLLSEYLLHPAMQNRLGASDCHVNLSFGLHSGWAIEGAVGSEFKIDASYLSPNVSIATSIERATETYGVSFLVSHKAIELCSTEIGAKCRLIDCVIIIGSAAPTKLHCVDLDSAAITVDVLEFFFGSVAQSADQTAPESKPLAPALCVDARDAAPTILVPLRPKGVVARHGSSSPPVSGQACALVAPTTAATLNFASLGVQRQRINVLELFGSVEQSADQAAPESKLCASTDVGRGQVPVAGPLRQLPDLLEYQLLLEVTVAALQQMRWVLVATVTYMCSVGLPAAGLERRHAPMQRGAHAKAAVTSTATLCRTLPVRHASECIAPRNCARRLGFGAAWCTACLWQWLTFGLLEGAEPCSLLQLASWRVRNHVKAPFLCATRVCAFAPRKCARRLVLVLPG